MHTETIQLDNHEVVVDRDWLETVGNSLVDLGNKELGEECIRISDYPEDEEEEDDEPT